MERAAWLAKRRSDIRRIHRFSSDADLLVANRRLSPLVTTTIFLEYEDVLLRPEQRMATGMSKQDVTGFLSAFASAAEPVELHFQWRPQLKDAGDEMIVAAAINAEANALITHNTQDFARAARNFALRVLTPGELLQEWKK